MKLRNNGFTLIEMLATIAIIAVVVSGTFVFFTRDSVEDKLRAQIEQFIAYCDNAADFAIVKNETWGVVFIPPEWQENALDAGWQIKFQRLNAVVNEDLEIVARQWVDAENSEPLSLPKEIDLNIFVEERLWDIDDAPEVLEPLVHFFSTGEATDFEIEVIVDDGFIETQHVELDEWGKVAWREREEQRAEIEDTLGGQI